MESIYLLIPLSVLLVGVAVWAFFWAVNKGQFEDLDGPSRLALEEDHVMPPSHDTLPQTEDLAASKDSNASDSFNGDAKPPQG